MFYLNFHTEELGALWSGTYLNCGSLVELCFLNAYLPKIYDIKLAEQQKKKLDLA